MVWSQSEVVEILRDAQPDDDKYRRGVLAVWTGSPEFPGAAVLGVEAALRTGVGMVRYVGSERDTVLARRPEAVTQPGDATAWLVGSGMVDVPPTHPTTARLRTVEGPLICDAGALRADDLDALAGHVLILTPHAGEAARILGTTRAAVEVDRAGAASEISSRFAATVLLKGHHTLVSSPNGRRVELEPATPRLATAGTGDVLAGILGALAASRPDADPVALAASASWIHSAAAERITGPILALELAEAVSVVIAELGGIRG
ncbi:MAG TPA: ADP/ATP-dependent (S)-NAD(P)H-hydrate dehydratase [Microbacteriaceae bacterium]|nr:ADP/ATP-dependent (S)-NAD(P)H-hydrate dehydratase [Microbacteriaceae bacterium]